MKKIRTVILAAAALPAFAPAAQAQNLDDTFRKVSPFVVVVRSKGRDVGPSGIVRFNETGSGVLISSDGRVMTAAHVVNGMDEITVQGTGGEVVRAKLLSANAAADVALLQLERVTAAMRVARIGDSDTVRVGEQVMVVGAPYGLAYSMSVGWVSARWPPNTISLTCLWRSSFRPRPRSTRVTPVAPCSTWWARSSASSARTSQSLAAARAWDLS
jgi:serine protease Do